MTVVLGIATVIAEIFTPQISRYLFNGFNEEQMALCVHLTRILLPAQIFFYVGGVVSAVLLSKRLFLFPAFGPLLYNVAIIVGGLLFSRQLGIAALAYGALAGAFLGPFLVNALGAAKIGTGYRPSFNIRNPAFVEWVRLSIPLMLGVSLVTADDWILRHFASHTAGDITRLNYAKRLFAVPIAVLGLGSLGVLALTERGRQVLAWLNDQFEQAPDRLLDFNDAVQRELDRIQIALDRVAESLNAA